ncbi:MAG: YkgJ family cysteine cluster protein [Armatimonadota bacterium]
MNGQTEARWLRERYEQLPTADCAGCEGCASRCMGNLAITRAEFEAIREFLGGAIYQPTVRHSGRMATPCEFSDPDGPRCLIYPVRPLICRLFGVVEWLPCPRGRVPALVPDGPRIMEQYRRFERRSFREWMREDAASDN